MWRVTFGFVFVISFCFGLEDWEQVLLDTQNALRSKVALGNQPGAPSAAYMAKLTWDSDLAATAQAWADECQGMHDLSRKAGIGENAFWWPDLHNNFAKDEKYGTKLWKDYVDDSADSGIGTGFYEYMVQKWFDEIHDFTGSYSSYNPAASHGRRIGHYTQMVWGESAKLGCGVKTGCDGFYWFQLYCRYDPTGNFFKKPIYIEGEPCSKCNQTCSQGLCSGEPDDQGVESTKPQTTFETTEATTDGTEAQTTDTSVSGKDDSSSSASATDTSVRDKDDSSSSTSTNGESATTTTTTMTDGDSTTTTIVTVTQSDERTTETCTTINTTANATTTQTTTSTTTTNTNIDDEEEKTVTTTTVTQRDTMKTTTETVNEAKREIEKEIKSLGVDGARDITGATCQDKWITCGRDKRFCGTIDWVTNDCPYTCSAGRCDRSHNPNCKDHLERCPNEKRWCGRIPWVAEYCPYTCSGGKCDASVTPRLDLFQNEVK